MKNIKSPYFTPLLRFENNKRVREKTVYIYQLYCTVYNHIPIPSGNEKVAERGSRRV
jgi:hypothetical protein